MVLAINVEKLIMRRDSKIIFGQVMRSSEAKEDNIKRHSLLAKGMAA